MTLQSFFTLKFLTAIDLTYEETEISDDKTQTVHNMRRQGVLDLTSMYLECFACKLHFTHALWYRMGV